MKDIIIFTIAVVISIVMGFIASACFAYAVCYVLGVEYSIKIALATWIIVASVTAIIRNAVGK